MHTYEVCCTIRNIINSGKSEAIELLPTVIKFVNPTELSQNEMLDLGFGLWDHSTNLMLIPYWLMKFIDPEIEVTCISGEVVKLRDADDDTRFGCIAYGVYPK